MRKALILALGLTGLAVLLSLQPALADCRSENTACVKGASTPFDSVACGSLYRSCAANHARAHEQARQMQNGNKPALQNAGGNRSGRR
jgi:hypothetical protein